MRIKEKLVLPKEAPSGECRGFDKQFLVMIINVAWQLWKGLMSIVRHKVLCATFYPPKSYMKMRWSELNWYVLSEQGGWFWRETEVREKCYWLTDWLTEGHLRIIIGFSKVFRRGKQNSEVTQKTSFWKGQLHSPNYNSFENRCPNISMKLQDFKKSRNPIVRIWNFSVQTLYYY